MKHLIEVAKMNRGAAANLVAGHGSSSDTGNDPPSVSISSVKTDDTRGGLGATLLKSTGRPYA